MRNYIRILFLVFLLNCSSHYLFASAAGDSAQITVGAYDLTNSEIRSLIDKNINIILNSETSQSDIQSLISLDASHLLLDGRGFDFTTVNTWLNAGASVILDRSFSTFDLKSLTSSGENKVYILATGFEIFDLEAFITNGANIVFDRSTQYSYLKSTVSKYQNRIYINTKGFSLFELNDLISYGAGVWIGTALATGDIRNLIKKANRYGGNVIINQRQSYFDIIFLLSN